MAVSGGVSGSGGRRKWLRLNGLRVRPGAGGQNAVLRTPPERTWLWSDLHLSDRAALEAWKRPFRHTRELDRRLLREWRRAVKPGDTIICLGDVAHPDA